jgi:hypothetical protein
MLIPVSRIVGKAGNALCSAGDRPASSRGRRAQVMRHAGSARFVRAVIRPITPPLPAVSRPSNTTMMRAPVAWTQVCRRVSSNSGREPRQLEQRFVETPPLSFVVDILHEDRAPRRHLDVAALGRRFRKARNQSGAERSPRGTPNSRRRSWSASPCRRFMLAAQTQQDVHKLRRKRPPMFGSCLVFADSTAANSC